MSDCNEEVQAAYKLGLSEGYDTGFAEGDFNRGYKEGYKEGYDKGYAAAPQQLDMFAAQTLKKEV